MTLLLLLDGSVKVGLKDFLQYSVTLKVIQSKVELRKTRSKNWVLRNRMRLRGNIAPLWGTPSQGRRRITVFCSLFSCSALFGRLQGEECYAIHHVRWQHLEIHIKSTVFLTFFQILCKLWELSWKINRMRLRDNIEPPSGTPSWHWRRISDHWRCRHLASPFWAPPGEEPHAIHHVMWQHLEMQKTYRIPHIFSNQSQICYVACDGAAPVVKGTHPAHGSKGRWFESHLVQ